MARVTSNITKVHLADTVSAVYAQHRWLHPMTLEWDANTQSFFTSDKGRHPKYRKYKCISRILMGGIMTFAALLVIIDAYSSNASKGGPSSVRMLIVCVMMPISLFLAGVAWLIDSHLGELIGAMRGMKRILEEIDKCDSHRSRRQMDGDAWATLSVLLTRTLQLYFFLLPFIPIFEVWFEFDMFYSLQSYVNPDSAYLLNICRLLRYACFVTIFIEGYRINTVFVSVLFYWLEMHSKYLRILGSGEERQDFVGRYKQLQLVSQMWETCLNSWLQLMLAAFYVIIVVCLVISFNYAGELPLLIYWFMPSTAAWTSGVLYFVFPPIVECHEVTVELIREGRMQSSMNFKGSSRAKARAYLKELKALRPISNKCGSSFILKRDTKSTFYDAIVERTVEGILMP